MYFILDPSADTTLRRCSSSSSVKLLRVIGPDERNCLTGMRSNCEWKTVIRILYCSSIWGILNSFILMLITSSESVVGGFEVNGGGPSNNALARDSADRATVLTVKCDRIAIDLRCANPLRGRSPAVASSHRCDGLGGLRRPRLPPQHFAAWHARRIASVTQSGVSLHPLLFFSPM